MGHRCCSKQKVKKGLWSPEEDEKLLKHITTHGHGSWSSVPKLADGDSTSNSNVTFTFTSSSKCSIASTMSPSIESRPISSSTTSSVNPSGFGLLDESYYSIWGNNTMVEPYRVPSVEGLQLQEQEQELQEEKMNDNIYEANNTVHQDIDCSFDSSSFDLEFVESTFMSGAMCRDLSSISIDDFAWNF
ncbi:hypothetical protein Patl1_19789 [Pistacia atlantica]|uniref:Uncharacterized protein n=1 Tax=Pistacia atlantica TaxID=434234 RepID=A0ACC1BJA1_9ROSI|nr:hypothetical protein Patl1_19789 [Pistacia atlantica]